MLLTYVQLKKEWWHIAQVSSIFFAALKLSRGVGKNFSGLEEKDKTAQMACSYPNSVAQYWFLLDKN